MKTAIRESCLDLFGGEFCISTDSSSPRDEKWILLQCGICVVSSSSTLDSTSKIQAACFLSSAFWMGFLQARKQAGMLCGSEGPSVFLSAGLLYFAFIHPPGMLFRRDTKRYVMGPQHHWALHSWIQSFADQKYSQKGLHLWWASRNSLPLAIYANSFSQNIYVVLVLRVVCRWLKCLRRCAQAWCSYYHMLYEDDFWQLLISVGSQNDFSLIPKDLLRG